MKLFRGKPRNTLFPQQDRVAVQVLFFLSGAAQSDHLTDDDWSRLLSLAKALMAARRIEGGRGAHA
jgi:hypothetical protein